MSKINLAIHEIHFLDEMAERDGWLNHIHPLSKVIVTIWYLVLVMSFPKYELSGLAGMCLYPVCMMVLGDISVKRALSQLKPVILAVCLIGISNPFLDKTPILKMEGLVVTGGMISMITLVTKTVFALLASYLLIVSTQMENICYALRMIRVPRIFVVLIMLIYRYIILMLKEAERVTQAYSMRAPNQKGIHYKVWGTLVGQMLLRSVDRAEMVYESMLLRGFRGEFYLKGMKQKSIFSICYGVVMCTLLLLFRVEPVFEIVGKLMTG